MDNNKTKTKSFFTATGLLLLIYVGAYIGITRYSNYVNMKHGGEHRIIFAPLTLLTDKKHINIFDTVNTCSYYFYFPAYWLDHYLTGAGMVSIMHDLG